MGRDAGAHERSCPVAHDPAKTCIFGDFLVKSQNSAKRSAISEKATFRRIFRPADLGKAYQTHTFQGFFAGTDHEFTQCAYNGD